jgi:hypothetical protein
MQTIRSDFGSFTLILNAILLNDLKEIVGLSRYIP